MDVIVRRVFKHGKSYSITIPRKWDIPDVLNVYSNGDYIVYSPIKGLEGIFNVRFVTQVKKRAGISKRKYRYYLLTIPVEVVERTKLPLGAEVLVLKTTVLNDIVLVCITKEDLYKHAILSLVKGETS